MNGDIRLEPVVPGKTAGGYEGADGCVKTFKMCCSYRGRESFNGGGASRVGGASAGCGAETTAKVDDGGEK